MSCKCLFIWWMDWLQRTSWPSTCLNLPLSADCMDAVQTCRLLRLLTSLYRLTTQESSTFWTVNVCCRRLFGLSLVPTRMFCNALSLMYVGRWQWLGTWDQHSHCILYCQQSPTRWWRPTRRLLVSLHHSMELMSLASIINNISMNSGNADDAQSGAELLPGVQ